MSKRFVNPTELRTVDIGDGDWIKIPARLSYGFIEQFGIIDGNDTEKTVGFLLKIIKEWNFTDDTGAVPAIDADHLRALDVETITKVISLVTEKISLPKAQSPQ